MDCNSFLGYDAGELMDKMLMLDRFKINQQKLVYSLRTLGYHHKLGIFSNLACGMLIKSS